MVSRLSTLMTVTSPPDSGASPSPRSTLPRQPLLPTPWSEPTPIVMMRSLPFTSALSTRPFTGSAVALSQLGFFGSGFLMSHLGNLPVHARTSRTGGVGQGIVRRHAGIVMSGGVGHLPAHAG